MAIPISSIANVIGRANQAYGFFKEVAPAVRQAANDIAGIVRLDADRKEQGVDTGTTIEETNTTHTKINSDGTKETTTKTEKTVTEDPVQQARYQKQVIAPTIEGLFSDFENGNLRFGSHVIDVKPLFNLFRLLLGLLFGPKEKDNSNEADYELGEAGDLYDSEHSEPAPPDSEAQSLSDVYNGTLGDEALKPVADLLGGEANLVGILSNLTPDTLEALATVITKIQDAKKGEKPKSESDEGGASI